MEDQQIGVHPNVKENYKPFLVMKTFYRMLYIFSCLDYGFFEQKSFGARLFWRIITVLRLVFFVGLDLILLDYGEFLPWLIFYFSYYFINVFILMSLSPNNTFYQLHCDLKNIDIQLQKSSSSYKLEIKIVSCAIVDIVLKFVAYTLFCMEKNYCVRPVVARYVFLWLIISVGTVQLSCTFAFYSLFCRLKHFSFILQTENRDNLSMQFIYKSIVDLAEIQKSAFSPMVSGTSDV